MILLSGAYAGSSNTMALFIVYQQYSAVCAHCLPPTIYSAGDLTTSIVKPIDFWTECHIISKVTANYGKTSLGHVLTRNWHAALVAITVTIILVPYFKSSVDELQWLDKVKPSGSQSALRRRATKLQITQIARFVWPTWGPPGSWRRPRWPHESCSQGSYGDLTRARG